MSVGLISIIQDPYFASAGPDFPFLALLRTIKAKHIANKGWSRARLGGIKEPLKTRCILQVEDDENDVFLLRRVFQKAGMPCPLQVVGDGQAAIDYLSGTGVYSDREKYPLPCLVLLDLKLPMRGGLEVLKWIRQHPVLKKLVVVVFSSSDRHEDVDRAWELGTNSYITKPAEIQKTLEIAQLLKGWWLGYNHFAPIQEPTSDSSSQGRSS